MKTSANGVSMIQAFEGFSSEAYQDIGGIWTNGYGNTHEVNAETPPISQYQATEDLENNLTFAESVIADNVTVDLNQNQFDALVSFIFNVGEGAEGVKDGFVTLHVGRQSHSLTCLNAGDYEGTANEFPKWNHDGGVISLGLTNRRAKERALFLS